MSGTYPYVDVWRLSHVAIKHIYAELQADGKRSREGIAMLGGYRRGDFTAAIDTVLLLRGRNVRRHAGLLDIDHATMNALTDALLQRGRMLVGLIHSHPPDCSTDLSFTDTHDGIAVPSFLSIVVPAYGARHSRALIDSWGVHVYDAGKGWLRFSDDEARRRVQIDRSVPCERVFVDATSTDARMSVST